jgi:putative transposase
MPWKELRIMGLKVEFVERASKPNANISVLCREFGISRETGHKWLRRFGQHGYDGLEEQSRRPKGVPLATAEDVVVAIVAARDRYPTWGPRKLEVVVRRQFGDSAPSERTIARVLKRFGRVQTRRKAVVLNVVERAPLVTARASNDVWTVDFKGWWRTRDGTRCEPLTVRDAFSRFVLAVEPVIPNTASVRAVLTRLFERYGLPKAIQCDNGTPFISTRSRGGLTKLSAWWVSLGIRVVRSRLAAPQDNGAHERMHRDIAVELQGEPARTLRLQKRALARWRHTFNHVRPHDALAGRTPAEIYKPLPSSAPSREPRYGVDWLRRTVNTIGYISVNGVLSFVGHALAGHRIALQHIAGLRYRIWFYELDLGIVEVEPAEREIETVIAKTVHQRQLNRMRKPRTVQPKER